MKHAIVVFDIDGVLRDVSGSYRRALADTVEHFTAGGYRPASSDVDTLKNEGIWNNDWEASRELVYRYFEAQGRSRTQLDLDYDQLIAFFQSRYRGTTADDPSQWTGYICNEPLLLEPAYLQQLHQTGFVWGFFSGATRASATYVLQHRLGVNNPLLVAMEDAPGKPDPTGLVHIVRQLEATVAQTLPVLYVGDTVADMQTVQNAHQQYPGQSWIAVGVIPPHAQTTAEYAEQYADKLTAAGAAIVLPNVQGLTPDCIQALV